MSNWKSRKNVRLQQQRNFQFDSTSMKKVHYLMIVFAVDLQPSAEQIWTWVILVDTKLEEASLLGL